MDKSELNRVADIHAQLDALARGQLREGERHIVRDTLGQEHVFNTNAIRAWPAAKARMVKALTGTHYFMVSWNGHDATPHGSMDLVLRDDTLTRNGMCMYLEQLTPPLEWHAPEIAELPEGALIRYGHHELRLLAPARVSSVIGRFGFVTPLEDSEQVTVEFEGSIHESPRIGITEMARSLSSPSPS